MEIPCLLRAVQQAASQLHMAQDVYEYGPTQNHKFTENIMRFVCVCVCVCDCMSQWIYYVAQDNASSSSVPQGLQKVKHPYLVFCGLFFVWFFLYYDYS